MQLFIMYNVYRTHEHKVSVLQGPESAGEYVVLQSQIETSDWTDALQHPTMSCQVRPSALSSVIPVFSGRCLLNLFNLLTWVCNCSRIISGLSAVILGHLLSATLFLV